MHNPPHPGRVLRNLYLEPLALTVTEVAERLGVTRKTVSELLNGRAGISPDMALRIGIATHSTPESWLGMQMYHDLWQAKQNKKSKVLHRMVKPLKKKAA